MEPKIIEVWPKEIAEILDFEDQKELIQHIIFTCFSEIEFNKFMLWLLNDLKSNEQEFEKRKKVIDAYTTIINTFKKSPWEIA